MLPSAETTVIMREDEIEYGPPLIEDTSMTNLNKQSNFKFFGQTSPSRFSRRTSVRSGVFGHEFASPISKIQVDEGESGFIAEKIALMTQEVNDNPTFEVIV